MARAGEPAPLRRIVHVTEAPLGGVVSYLDELIGAQIRQLPGVQVDLITPEINCEALSHLTGPDFRMTAFRHRRGSPLALMEMALMTLRHVRRTRPDIVHIHSTFAGAAVRVFRPLFPRATRVVYCPHGWAFARQGSVRMQRISAMIELVLARFCDRIICISAHERHDAMAHGIAQDRLVVIENGISPAQLTGAPAEPRHENGMLIAFAGRFDRQKGFDTFLDVMRGLGERAQGIAIGSAITSSASLPDIPGNVRILGWQPREAVYDLFRRADLLLVPSRWEGFGLVAAEAMQLGLPVFASRVGGLQDVVVDGVTGRLFQPDDAPAVIRMINDTSDADLRRYGENGRIRYLERYTADRMSQMVTALYQRLMKPD